MAFESGNLQQQQRWCVAEAIGAHHQAELDFCGTLQEMFRVSMNGDAGRDEDERQHGDHNGEEAVPLNADQVILQRHDDEEAPEQCAVVAAARGHQGHVLAEREERDDREEHQRAHATHEQRERKDRAHFPPGADARVQIVNRGAAGIGAVARFQKAADQAGNHQKAKHAAEEPHQLGIVNRLQHQAGPIRRRLLTASRARSRNACFSSPGST